MNFCHGSFATERWEREVKIWTLCEWSHALVKHRKINVLPLTLLNTPLKPLNECGNKFQFTYLCLLLVQKYFDSAPYFLTMFNIFEPSQKQNCILWVCIPYAHHYNLLLIRNRSWILTIHKAKGTQYINELQKVGKKYTNRRL